MACLPDGEIFVAIFFEVGKFSSNMKKCSMQMGLDITTDRSFMDPKWIRPPANFRTFRLHKDWRWDDFETHFHLHTLDILLHIIPAK